MNIIDIAILAILVVSIGYGIYKGFVHALLSLGCGLLAPIPIHSHGWKAMI